MRAAVLRAVGDETLDLVDDVEVLGPGPGEVRVRIVASGVCHSDLSGMNGTIPTTTPAVLGHEGAGEVLAVGEGVSSVHVGDHAILSWMPPCGTCVDCIGGQPQLCTLGLTSGATPRFRSGGEFLHSFAGTGTFAEETVVPAQAVIAIDKEVPFDVASLVGCGVMTGVGAAINTARVKPGSSTVVFGCGGVGISVIQGCRIGGAAEIVAVDRVPAKLEMAKRLGATHAVAPEDLAGVQSDLTGGRGFDYAFEAVGSSVTIRAAFDATRRGGTTVVVGVGRLDDFVQLSAFELFFNEKNLKGSLYGSADVRTDFARLLRLWRAGKLDLEGMISARTGLDGVNDAFGAMQRGEVIRTVIEL
ncbi:MAG: Zn-dependent alcohol dehydrogenase [Acidimicrobiia bacterium]|nr:Zn-dependent alcohol dehydrogenase [Acidimicrobiia bacterium]